MLYQLFFIAQSLLLASAVPVVVNPLPGLTKTELIDFMQHTDSKIIDLKKQMTDITEIKASLKLQKSFATGADKDPHRQKLKDLDANLASLKKQLKPFEKAKSTANRFVSGAYNPSVEQVEKIASIKAGFLAANQPETVKNSLVRVKATTHIPGLNPSEAQWHLNNVLADIETVSQEQGVMRAERAVASAFNRGIDIKDVPFDISTEGKTHEDIFAEVGRATLRLNQKWQASVTKMASLEQQRIEAKGFVNAAYKHSDAELEAIAKIKSKTIAEK